MSRPAYRHSAETRAVMSAKARARGARRPEVRAACAAGTRAYWARLSPEQRAQRAAQSSAANRAYWAAMSPEQRAARARALHRSHLTAAQRGAIVAAAQGGALAVDLAAQWHVTPKYVRWLCRQARRAAERGAA